ncbi:CHAP domain-containing protein [Terriglobus saanensis]|uniref:Peptidoglycan-binding domain 1 protein n=1 Tax=Terriglobus saanensis (strain ATCC BAA-1853 / DSM 23119 / SP1PR4) TaxID=401053 RepID=E8V5P2_TERSS|nr:CHAP domain-containing protein [Terriglobus saanensis]ADV82651.1 Peptidoglycan-binding domain 1 protein [Terriglobus saanensis SP1PR4]
MPKLVFPGTTIMAGSTNKEAVTAIQKRLVIVGCGPVDVDGKYGAETAGAVEHFQARSVDSNGTPLLIDGKVGPTTWAVLFGDRTVPTLTKTKAVSPLLKKILNVAAGEIGTMEVPPGSNRGPEVDLYIEKTGLDPAGHFAWCACFVYWCFDKAAGSLDTPNPCPKTAGVLAHWADANHVSSARRILSEEAQNEPSLIVPGTLFLLRTSGTAGHMGLIEEVHGNQLTTIEGNTNDGGSREGIGVFRRTTRTIGQINLGFVLYS